MGFLASSTLARMICVLALYNPKDTLSINIASSLPESATGLKLWLASSSTRSLNTLASFVAAVEIVTLSPISIITAATVNDENTS